MLNERKAAQYLLYVLHKRVAVQRMQTCEVQGKEGQEDENKRGEGMSEAWRWLLDLWSKLLLINN